LHGFGPGYDHIGNRVPGPGFGELAPEGVDPWDTSRWTITEWAAAAGLVASLYWIMHLSRKK
jgi:hypothetical protein